MGHHANGLAFRLQYRPLLDMQLQHRMHLARADLLLPDPADARQFLAKDLALHIAATFGVFLRMDAREHPRRQHGRSKPRALLIRPVRHHDGAPCPHPHVVHRPHHLQRAQHAENAVIFPPRRLGIQMRPHVNREGLRIGPRPRREHVAHAVHAHGHPRRFAPALEQMPPLAVGIGQRLAVAAPGHAGADHGHLLKAVPQPRGIDPKVFPGCWHSLALPVRCRRLPARSPTSLIDSHPDRMVNTKATTT